MLKWPVLLLVLLSVTYAGAAQQTTIQIASVTQYGFYPSPPRPDIEAVLQHFADISEHGDFILSQPNIAWEDFTDTIEGESPSRTDLKNIVTVAQVNGLSVVFVIDPLNGLNRREFSGLPANWEASFANPDVRAAFTNFALWVVREFQPDYLGLASEINTYMDTFPHDAPNYLSLYHETYAAIKAESPDTQVFVTFQWEDLNNLWPGEAEGREPYQTNWDQIEVFEPYLDIWAISTYPSQFQISRIPDNYYTALLERTDKPLAVAEGGYTARPIYSVSGTPEDQVAFLNAVHDQIGSRLVFWAYTLLNDLDMDSYRDYMQIQGTPADDITTLSVFQSIGLREVDGTPRLALAVWDSFWQP